MKGILVTQKYKDDNPDLFSSYNVGEIAKVRVPNRFKDGDFLIFGVDHNIEKQEELGFKEIVIPNYDGNTQKLGSLISTTANTFTYEVLDLTQVELDARIPNEITTLAFKIELKKLGLSNQQVKDAIDIALQQNLIDEATHYEAMLKWTESTMFIRTDPTIIQLLPLVNTLYNINITEDDINNIFKVVSGLV